MGKINGVLVTIIGILLVLWAAGVIEILEGWGQWLLALIVLAVGIVKLFVMPALASR